MIESVPVTIYHNPACGTSRNTLALIRNAGVEVATVCELLHRMGPLLLTQQTRHYDRAQWGAIQPLLPEVLQQYVVLADRLGKLLRDLCYWRER